MELPNISLHDSEDRKKETERRGRGRDRGAEGVREGGQKERDRDRERRRGREERERGRGRGRGRGRARREWERERAVRSPGDAGPAHGRGTGARSAWETSKKLEGQKFEGLEGLRLVRPLRPWPLDFPSPKCWAAEAAISRPGPPQAVPSPGFKFPQSPGWGELELQ